ISSLFGGNYFNLSGASFGVVMECLLFDIHSWFLFGRWHGQLRSGATCVRSMCDATISLNISWLKGRANIDGKVEY
ncbi:MAG: hypothetical protein AAFN81_17005, partial [Bacteroidota bacterium]